MKVILANYPHPPIIVKGDERQACVSAETIIRTTHSKGISVALDVIGDEIEVAGAVERTKEYLSGVITEIQNDDTFFDAPPIIFQREEKA
jgi:hypothetical protein